MAPRRKKDRETIRTAVLTLRLTQEEMLKLKVAALGLRKKRSKIIRERVADLIGWVVENAGTDAVPQADAGNHKMDI